MGIWRGIEVGYTVVSVNLFLTESEILGEREILIE
jgi:hypothetical protein